MIDIIEGKGVSAMDELKCLIAGQQTKSVALRDWHHFEMLNLRVAQVSFRSMYLEGSGSVLD